MNSREKTDIGEIARHVKVLNGEVGNLQSDVKWIKRIVYYMAGTLSLAVGKIVFFT